jgi:hypothetical protein
MRVLNHPRRHAPEEKPVNASQPFGSRHDQIGMLLGGHLHDLFSRITKPTESFSRKSRLDQFLCALFD